MATKTKQSAADPAGAWPFGKRNYLVLGIALAIIIIGYVLLGQGSMTMAPLLLVVGYCVLVPIGLWIRGDKAETEAPAEQS